MKILITGAGGQLGLSFQARKHLAKALDIDLIFADRSQLDITDSDNINSFCQQHNFSAIINTAAYTAVDLAEKDIEQAALINETGPANLASYCQQHQLSFIHISTDYVFNGESTSSYQETDPVSPLGIYGKTKYAGEVAVLKECPAAIIIRTSWVFSEFGDNFLKTMLRLANDRSQLSIVSDQWGAPTYAPHIAEAVLAIINPKTPPFPSGIYHFSGHQKTNWQLFAAFIFTQQSTLDSTFTAPFITPITTEQYPTPAARPMNSHLSNQKILELLPNLECNWQQGVISTLKALQA